MNILKPYAVFWVAGTLSNNKFGDKYKARTMLFDNIPAAEKLVKKLQVLQESGAAYQQCRVSHIAKNFTS